MGLCFHRALPGTATHRQGLHQADLGFRHCPQLAGGAFTGPPGPATRPAWPYPGAFKRCQAKRRKPAAQSGRWLLQGPPFWQLSHPTVVYAKEQPEPVKGGETDGLSQGHPLGSSATGPLMAFNTICNNGPAPVRLLLCHSRKAAAAATCSMHPTGHMLQQSCSSRTTGTK